MKKIYISTLLLIVLCYNLANSQPKKSYVYKGNLRSQSGNSITINVIGLHRAVDSVLTKGSLTDSLGAFVFNNVAPGNYLLSYSMSDKTRRFCKKVTIDSISSSKIDTIYLENDGTSELKEVRVRARKPFLDRQIDRLVIDLRDNPLTTGNSAYEALGKLPGLSVDPINGIRLNGANGVLILIDGQGNRQSNNEINTLLNNLRAENIDKIEIFSNPPVRFDAQGTGVINIILKKDKALSDFHSTYSQRIHPSEKVNGQGMYLLSLGTNFNYAFNKLKTNTVVDYSHSTDNVSADSTYYNGISYYRTNYRYSESSTTRLFINNKSTYDLTKKDGLIFNIRFSNVPLTSNKTLNFDYFKNNHPNDQNSSTNISNELKTKNLEYYINYTHKFDKDGKSNLNVLILRGQQKLTALSEYTTIDENENISRLDQDREYSVDINAAKIDYSFTAKGYDSEMGFKQTYIRNREEYLYNNNLQTQVFNFKEKITAFYFSSRRSWKQWSTQFGIRGEYTSSFGEVLSEDTTTKRNYINFFPSFIIQRNLSKNMKLNISYSKRINRPFYGDFNPVRYINANDVYYTRGGNSLLSVQIINKIEGSISYKNIYLALGLQHRNGVRALYTEAGGDRQLITIPYNTISRDIYLSTSYNYSIAPWWQVNFNSNIYSYYLTLLDNDVRQTTSFDFTTNQAFKISSKLNADFSIRYASPFIAEYYKISSVFNVNAAIRYNANKIFVVLGVDDLLGTNRPRWFYDYNILTIQTIPQFNQRQVRISLAYKFKSGNKFQAKSKSSNDFGEIRY
ncbi:outer membrane beta-barrel family protein [Spirosoma sordidisoli]|uniref:Outer membrane protein beta-barrel domain-containing protein n=1 Tax=Spirosoma sordidisoli TaxID=2502893 RepID=A0A4Q2UHJ7_9BACT|nr:outer membrane beta-barrel family protein [Spirosoma sordidisoli]RYC66945.1 hypothetical protein EQG79_26570 [Spirosoma sordidisoli]